MRNVIALAGFLLLSLPAYAEETTITVAYDAASAPVSSTIDIEAEYVAMELTLSSSADSPSQRLKQTQALIAAITLAASKDLSFVFQMGDVSVAPVDMLTTTPASESSKYYLFTNLKPEEDIYTATQDLHDFIKKVSKPSKTSVTTGEVGLALSDPEKYRDQLLHTISKDIKRVKEVLDTESSVTVSGLENPVYIRRKDDKKITLFLDYKISLDL